MDFNHLIINYGYFAVVLGGMLEGESILILGGLAVKAGLLKFPLMILSAYIGAILIDAIFFFSGRFAGHRILNKWPWLVKKIEKPTALIHGRANWVSLFLRFMYGFRTVVPFSLGMSKIKTWKFLLLDGIGALVWVIFMGIIGYAFGQVIEIFFGRFGHNTFRLVVIIILAAVIIGYILKFVKKEIRVVVKEKEE